MTMAATKQALPIILCGKASNVANAVIAVMQPQVRVIHTCFDVESAKLDVAKLLSRGSEDRPQAVVLGGAFDDTAFAQIHASARNAGQQTTWLRHDHSIQAKVKPQESQEGYGSEVGQRAKDLLLRLAQNGELDPPTDKVVVY